MKKNILFTGAFIFFIVSCSTNKNLGNPGNENPESYVNPYGSKFFLKPDVAKAMIAAFPKHAHRVFGKKKLTNSWASFDPSLMNAIYNDGNVDALKYFLAAKQKNGDPTIVLQVKYKTPPPKGKGALDEKLYPPNGFYRYFGAETMCPPPSDCILEN